MVSFTHAGLPPPPPTASMNNGLSNINGPKLHPLAADVGNHRERKGKGIIVIIILSSVFAFILCAGAALVVYFKLRSRSHLTEASLVPTKPAGTKTFCLWIIVAFLFHTFLCVTFEKSAKCSVASLLSSRNIICLFFLCGKTNHVQQIVIYLYSYMLEKNRSLFITFSLP